MPLNSIDFAKNPALEDVVKYSKFQIRNFCQGIKEQIERIGKFLKENKLVMECDICTEIKSYLKEEIEERLISERTIDRYCPDTWKHKTKPKGERQLSFYKEGKNEQTATNRSINTIPNGQILQQEFESPSNLRVMAEGEKLERTEVQYEVHTDSALERNREGIDKLKEKKQEDVWTAKGYVKYGDVQLSLIITVNSRLKKIERVLLDIHEFYFNYNDNSLRM